MEENKSGHGHPPARGVASYASASHPSQPKEALPASDTNAAPSSTTTPDHEQTFPISSLLAEIAGLRQDFETKVKYDESKERLIESLHQELQGHREGLHLRVLRPMFLDLISLYDEFDSHIEQSQSESEVDKLSDTLTLFQEMIAEILYRNGVESFTTEENLFLPSQQRIHRVIATDNQQQDKHIARRVKKGFTYEGQLLRPEIVEIYRWQASH